MTYETPEIFELGEADELTMGQIGLPCEDACECSKSSCGSGGEVILA